MQDLQNKKIILGITGGIAAYKTAILARELSKLGAEIKVVMTQSASEFVTPLTLQALTNHEVRINAFDSDAERAMSHIELARWADYLLIAPVTANFIAKMANGIADDLLSTLYLVCTKPTIICPAMNSCMWQHPAVIANVKTLLERSTMIVGPEYGEQACGEIGYGRMSESEAIINALRLYEYKGLLKNKKVLITAGPTIEEIDPVRFISNYSSGKMGYALAEAAAIAGAQVTLISGPTKLNSPTNVKLIKIKSTQEMLKAVLKALEQDMIFIANAAVTDYRIEIPEKEKIKKSNQDKLTLVLVKNPDILNTVAQQSLASVIIGFAAETNNVIENAKKKLNKKNLDMIVANQVGNGLGFNSDFNKVTILTKDNQINLNVDNKLSLAGKIIEQISKINK